ncbi:MAG TPA: cytochrome c biogenesis CcdA family protein [Acidimicrobiales bacterium]|jgi:cytochrome c biogenesis protein CcdA
MERISGFNSLTPFDPEETLLDAPIAFAFGAGLVAAFNPCGFAMLPAYLSFFIGGEHDDDDASVAAGVGRALAVGGAVSLGFTLVFGVVGLLVTQFSLSIQQYLPWMTVVIGLALIPLGIAMLRGFQLKIALPALDHGTDGRSPASMFVFGVSYAVVSLTCTLPVFLAAVATTFRSADFVSGMAVFGAYALGMALVLMVLTVGLALARKGIVARMRRFLPYVNRVSGGFLALAGVYVAYYGWFEIQISRGNINPTLDIGPWAFDLAWPADFVSQRSADMSNWVASMGAARLGLIAVGSIVLVVTAALALRRPPADPTSDGDYVSGRAHSSGPRPDASVGAGSRD